MKENFMVKITSGSRIGTKAICAVVDDETLDALPVLATDNNDGTATLNVVDTAGNESLDSIAACIIADKLQIAGTLTGIISSAVCTDNGPEWTVLRNPGYSADASSTALDVATPTTGKKIIVDDLHIGVTTACVISLYEESNATAIWAMPIAANSPYVLTTRDLIRLVTASKKLQLKTSVTAPVYTNCLYHEV